MGILMPLTIPLAYALDPTYSFVIVAVIFGYIQAGLGMPVWLVLSIDIVIIGLIVRFVGKKVEV
jgi:hypothetical protein